MSFAAKFINAEGGDIRVLTAKEANRDAWFVLKLNPQSYVDFKSIMRSGNGNIRDYGIILESGWGILPEHELRTLKSKYQAA